MNGRCALSWLQLARDVLRLAAEHWTSRPRWSEHANFDGSGGRTIVVDTANPRGGASDAIHSVVSPIPQ